MVSSLDVAGVNEGVIWSIEKSKTLNQLDLGYHELWTL